MALRKILTKGDEQLAKHCRPVEKFDDRLHVLIDDMRETLENSGGVGLAAPQIGILRRVVVLLDVNKEPEEMVELVNPEVIEQRGSERVVEGCLSVPGVYGYVTRPTWAKIRAQDRYGNWFEREGEGVVAQCFCHETEHLDGHLFIEKVGRGIMRVVFMGTPDFAVPSLQALLDAGHEVAAVYTQPDKPQGRKQILTAPPVKELALAHGIPVFQPDTLKNEDEQARLRELAPEVIIVVAYGKLLPKAVLDIPPRGCINVHGSLLPRWRGAAPIQWAVIAGDDHADGGGTGHRRYAADERDAGRRTRDCRRAVRPPCAVGRGTFDRNARQTE